MRCGMRWTKADDDAIQAAGHALAGTRTVWQPAEYPIRDTVHSEEAKKRFSRITERRRDDRANEPLSGLSAFVSVETPKKAFVTRQTPMRERAERVGVTSNSTPVELRQIVGDDENTSPGAVTCARASIHSFEMLRSHDSPSAQLQRAELDGSVGVREPGMATASIYLMDVHGYDNDGDLNGEPERRQTHDLHACDYELEGDSSVSFIRAMSTYELEQRLRHEFEFHVWLVLRQRQWTSQQRDRRVARHAD